MKSIFLSSFFILLFGQAHSQASTWAQAISCTACTTGGLNNQWWQYPDGEPDFGTCSPEDEWYQEDSCYYDYEGNYCYILADFPDCDLYDQCTYEATSCNVNTNNWQHYEDPQPVLQQAICMNVTSGSLTYEYGVVVVPPNSFCMFTITNANGLQPDNYTYLSELIQLGSGIIQILCDVPTPESIAISLVYNIGCALFDKIESFDNMLNVATSTSSQYLAQFYSTYTPLSMFYPVNQTEIYLQLNSTGTLDNQICDIIVNLLSPALGFYGQYDTQSYTITSDSYTQYFNGMWPELVSQSVLYIGLVNFGTTPACYTVNTYPSSWYSDTWTNLANDIYGVNSYSENPDLCSQIISGNISSTYLGQSQTNHPQPKHAVGYTNLKMHNQKEAQVAKDVELMKQQVAVLRNATQFTQTSTTIQSLDMTSLIAISIGCSVFLTLIGIFVSYLIMKKKLSQGKLVYQKEDPNSLLTSSTN